MEGLPRRGEVIFLRFPYTDLSQTKNRPAVVLAQLPNNDMLVCQVTSRDKNDPDAVALEANDFANGGLPKRSFALPGQLFTANTSIVTHQAGQLNDSVVNEIVDRIVRLLRP